MKIPLAERIRPNNLTSFIGQAHLVGKNGVIRKMIEQKQLVSMILWGPPGVGKTTLANIIATQMNRPFKILSAISSGVKDVREVIQQAKYKQDTILFIDEIHRFNKSQQDALLGAVEKGIITLIGATTENPSFEVNAALLSRCQVYKLKEQSQADLQNLLKSALANDEYLQKKEVDLKETEALLRLADGDARKLLNLLEMVVEAVPETKVEITDEMVMDIAQQKTVLYDKSGEQHYDIISAFIKSIRGSDPNAALYWMARMIEGGEDPKFIARRLLILASEDIGNANPTAMVMATNCFQAVTFIGYPEADLILAQTATYLASSPKSNASYMGIRKAQQLVREKGNLPVPLHLRNAPTALMKKEGYGKGYKYAHDFPNNFAEQEFLPPEISGTKLYDPGKNPREADLRKRLQFLWKNKYNY
ncbi:replication-associated recombination protein A [Chondrinema litorale]|uniref:replication-associated recombination protein A n=1 Tax=Chondrinema litorale TaxID=2994555 RepID=UPI00254284A3|nr:replication-associated recombination protein A [Chondrinema litorale]UZR92752.1 replication-associated recombination protein A [Chondrinema litorale]